MKKHIINNIILISIMFLLITATALIYILDFQKNAREQYGAVSVSRVDAAKQYAEAVLNKGLNEVSSLEDASVLPQGYYAVTYTDDDLMRDNDGRIDLNTESGLLTYTLNNELYQDIKCRHFNFYYSDMIMLDFEDKFPLICFRKQTDSGGSILLFNYAETVLSEDYIFDFDNIILISPGGMVITDYYDDIRGYTINSEGFAHELLTGTGLLSTRFNNSQKLFCYTDFDESGVYKVAAYIDNEKEEVFIRSATGKVIITIVVIILTAALTVAFLVVIYIRHFNSIVLLKKRKNIFVVHVNRGGIIKRANTAYTNEFDYLNIHANTLDSSTSFIKILQDGLPVIANLKNKKGEQRYVIFFSLRTLNGYKLIGEDATPVMNTYFENLKETRLNEKLNMFNIRQFQEDYELAKKLLRTNDGLYALFEVRNISIYRSMFGEDFYNEILRKYADMLNEAVSDFGNIYYSNYEMFALFICDTDKAAAFKDRLKELMIKLNMPIQIGKSLIKVDCVAGVVDITDEYKNKTISELNFLADYSLEKAYELNIYYDIYDKNKGNYYISQNKKSEIAKSIIENNQLDMYFQPQYNIIKNKITGFEALVRIKGEHEKNLKIFEFIDIVERSGYMISIGDYIFNRAFEFAKQIEDSDVTVSVNVSPVQLLETGFVKGFLDKFDKYNVKKENIILEITETFVMTSFNEIITKLMVLRDNNINIHLDDFGVAYSSMLYLKRLPITTIKIDKAFVSDIIENEYSRIICKKIIELATELKLSVIAEGVETKQQMDCLQGFGCKVIQGYFISHAVPKADALILLKKRNGR